MDSTHHHYIIRAMQLGCDAITEKPMTIDAYKARAIFDAIATTRKSLRVTFNYRYAPLTTKVRELVMQGVVGRPLHVNFQWVLDTYHGADYFRRWHREKDKSGGLLVHKATHHFDIINWWIQSYPSDVYAFGDLMFYGRANASRRGRVLRLHALHWRTGSAPGPILALPGSGRDTSSPLPERRAGHRLLYATGMCSATTSPSRTR